ncbi:hypothetical protein B4107_3632 [Bacillus safensis]|nr:hypothetical protein B4107_3632 [Bacillus safensis]
MIPFCMLCSSYIPNEAMLVKEGGVVESQLILETFSLK